MNKKKKAQLTTQVLCALMLTGAALPGQDVLAATITNSQTYQANSPITDDIAIADGCISVVGDRWPSDTTVSLNGDVSIAKAAQGESSYVLLAQGDIESGYKGNLTVNPNKDKTVKLTGDVKAADYGEVTVNLSNQDSFLAGDLVRADLGKIALDLSNSSTWYAPGDSYALSDSLKISANGGNIDLWHATPATVRSKNAGKRTFAVSGAGTSLNGAAFRLSSDVQNSRADQVTLTGVSGDSNTYTVQVVYDPATDGTYLMLDQAPVVLTTNQATDKVQSAVYTYTTAADAGLTSKTVTLTPELVTSADGLKTSLASLTVNGNQDRIYRGSGTDAADITIQDGYAKVVAADSGKTVSLTGDVSIVNSAKAGYVLLAQGKAGTSQPGLNDGPETGVPASSAVLKVNPGKDKTVKLTGDVKAADCGEVTVNLSNQDSFLAGNLVCEDSGKIALGISQGSTWYAPDDSYALSDSLQISADGGNIDLWHATPTTKRSASAGTRTFAVSKAGTSLNGANFVLSSDIQNSKADAVTLTGVTGDSNQYTIQIANDPAMSVDGSYTAANGITVLTTDKTTDTVAARAYTTTKDAAAGLVTTKVTLTPMLVTTNGVTKLTALTISGNTVSNKESGAVTKEDGLKLDLPGDGTDIIQTYDGDLTVSPDSDGDSLHVTGGAAASDHSATLIINPNKDKTVKLDGDIQVTGKAKVQANLSNGDSYLAGALKQDSALGTINLDLSNGAIWYVSGDNYSLSDTLTLAADGGVLDLWHAHANSYRTGSQGTRTLNISSAGSSLNGAAFVLSSDIKSNKADLVNLTGVTGEANKYIIQIANDPAMSTDGTYTSEAGITVLKTDDLKDTVTAKAYKTTKDVAAGLMTKELTLTPTLVTTDGVTKLTALTVSGNAAAPGTDPGTETPAVQEGKAMVMAKVAGSSSQGTVAAWRSADNDLHRRMGDLRDDAGDAGAWGRIYGGKTEIRTSSPSNVSYHGIQAGYDRGIKAGDGKLFTGVALSFMDGDISGSGVSGDTDSKLAGIYGSYMGARGHFLDAIVKYGRMSSTTKTWSGTNRYDSDTASNGLNMSIEYGRRQDLKAGLYLEPQAEFNYSHIGSDDYTMRQNGAAGARIHNDSVNSCVGRLGVNVGRDTKAGNVYLKLSYLREFAGDTAVAAGYGSYSKRSSESFKDSWFEYGIGFSQKLASNQNLYGEFTQTAGADKMKESWKANLGFRLSF
ncbi:MAG: autotransporter outer membrane beta-barrel domain-containing protein [Selenomonas sp.]|nr:autotransporter outer membrane beta-barrel domain-containing protein [Selenomonas sp.]